MVLKENCKAWLDPKYIEDFSMPKMFFEKVMILHCPYMKQQSILRLQLYSGVAIVSSSMNNQEKKYDIVLGKYGLPSRLQCVESLQKVTR
jgi:hypothetical protein